MEQIAATAGVAKGTLYSHFSVKEAVLAYWLHLELAANLAMLHSQLDTRPGFAEGVLHGAAVPVNASPKTSPKPKKKDGS